MSLSSICDADAISKSQSNEAAKLDIAGFSSDDDDSKLSHDNKTFDDNNTRASNVSSSSKSAYEKWFESTLSKDTELFNNNKILIDSHVAAKSMIYSWANHVLHQTFQSLLRKFIWKRKFNRFKVRNNNNKNRKRTPNDEEEEKGEEDESEINVREQDIVKAIEMTQHFGTIWADHLEEMNYESGDASKVIRHASDNFDEFVLSSSDTSTNNTAENNGDNTKEDSYNGIDVNKEGNGDRQDNGNNNNIESIDDLGYHDPCVLHPNIKKNTERVLASLTHKRGASENDSTENLNKGIFGDPSPFMPPPPGSQYADENDRKRFLLTQIEAIDRLGLAGKTDWPFNWSELIQKYSQEVLPKRMSRSSTLMDTRIGATNITAVNNTEKNDDTKLLTASKLSQLELDYYLKKKSLFTKNKVEFELVPKSAVSHGAEKEPHQSAKGSNPSSSTLQEVNDASMSDHGETLAEQSDEKSSVYTNSRVLFSLRAQRKKQIQEEIDQNQINHNFLSVIHNQKLKPRPPLSHSAEETLQMANIRKEMDMQLDKSDLLPTEKENSQSYSRIQGALKKVGQFHTWESFCTLDKKMILVFKKEGKLDVAQVQHQLLHQSVELTQHQEKFKIMTARNVTNQKRKLFIERVGLNKNIDKERLLSDYNNACLKSEQQSLQKRSQRQVKESEIEKQQQKQNQSLARQQNSIRNKTPSKIFRTTETKSLVSSMYRNNKNKNKKDEEDYENDEDLARQYMDIDLGECMLELYVPQAHSDDNTDTSTEDDERKAEVKKKLFAFKSVEMNLLEYEPSTTINHTPSSTSDSPL